MTGTEIDVETQAQRIAARGREALVARMRTAYGDAAAAHADLISLDDERIEAMVQAAADRADGLQWRRALAGVAAEELGVSPTAALTHPAVVRAQALVGAPSYEQSLAEMIARPVPLPLPAAEDGAATENGGAAEGNGGTAGAMVVPEPPLPQPPAPPAPEPIPEPPAPEPEPEPEPVPGPAVAAVEPSDKAEPSDELETVEADDVVLELLPEPDPIEYETEAYDVEASFAHEQIPPAEPQPELEPAAEPELEAAAEPELEPAAETGTELTIPAVHLGGVANLPTKREGLSVRLSADGLDIMQSPSDIIGRLVWDEIEALEVPNLRVRRRSKQLRARLVVRTPHGDASFDVPEVSGDELREQVEPLMRLYGRH